MTFYACRLWIMYMGKLWAPQNISKYYTLSPGRHFFPFHFFSHFFRSYSYHLHLVNFYAHFAFDRFSNFTTIFCVHIWFPNVHIPFLVFDFLFFFLPYFYFIHFTFHHWQSLSSTDANTVNTGNMLHYICGWYFVSNFTTISFWMINRSFFFGCGFSFLYSRYHLYLTWYINVR